MLPLLTLAEKGPGDEVVIASFFFRHQATKKNCGKAGGHATGFLKKQF